MTFKEMTMKPLRLWMLFMAMTMAVPAGISADAGRLKDAQDVLTDMAGSGDRGIPMDLIASAKCLVVIPGVKKAALGFGGQYGRGYMTCRRPDGKTWSAPGGVRVEGGSVGFQIGASETDVVLVVRNQRGVDRLLSSKFTFGVDAAVAAGPVGRRASAETDATMRAEILAYSHSRGVFAGISLQGATLRDDGDENKSLYGSELSNKDIVTGDRKVPADAEGFMATVSKY
jgi:lipid-binding SYLF domain-containing protein